MLLSKILCTLNFYGLQKFSEFLMWPAENVNWSPIPNKIKTINILIFYNNYKNYILA